MVQGKETIRIELVHAQELVEKGRKTESNKEARQTLESAIEIFEKYVPYDGTLEGVYNDLGSICYKMDDFLSSLAYFHKARFFLRIYAIVNERTNELSEVDRMINTINQKIGLHIKHMDNMCYYVDKSDKVVIPGSWKNAKDFSEGLAAVQNDEDKWGYIDYHGKIIIPCVYDYAEPFENGIAGMSKEEDFNIIHYYDINDKFVGLDMEISRYFIQEMADAYILFINGKQEEALKKVLPLSEHFTLDISPQKMLADFYAEMGENKKLVEWCKRIIKFIEYNEIQASWPYLYLGYAYEYGIGVEEDLMKAFEHYHIVWCSIDHNDKNLDEFFERHPEMLKLPRVQETLNPFSEEEY